MQAHAYERVLLTEAALRVKEGERRGQIANELAEARQQRNSAWRGRAARLLIALAGRLSPDAVLAARANKPHLHT